MSDEDLAAYATEKAMGWTPTRCSSYRYYKEQENDEPWLPCSDYNDAMMLVEQTHPNGGFELRFTHEHKWSYKLGLGLWLEDDRGPRVITEACCLAHLALDIVK